MGGFRRGLRISDDVVRIQEAGSVYRGGTFADEDQSIKREGNDGGVCVSAFDVLASGLTALRGLQSCLPQDLLCPRPRCSSFSRGQQRPTRARAASFDQQMVVSLFELHIR